MVDWTVRRRNPKTYPANRRRKRLMISLAPETMAFLSRYRKERGISRLIESLVRAEEMATRNGTPGGDESET